MTFIVDKFKEISTWKKKLLTIALFILFYVILGLTSFFNPLTMLNILILLLFNILIFSLPTVRAIIVMNLGFVIFLIAMQIYDEIYSFGDLRVFNYFGWFQLLYDAGSEVTWLDTTYYIRLLAGILTFYVWAMLASIILILIGMFILSRVFFRVKNTIRRKYENVYLDIDKKIAFTITD